LHELYLTRTNCLDKLSDESAAFLAEHPEIVREEFGTLFDRDPFDFSDNTSLYYCPIDHSLAVTRSNTPPPDYSSESDEMSSSDVKKPKKSAKKYGCQRYSKEEDVE
jgi:hypothetical protein